MTGIEHLREFVRTFHGCPSDVCRYTLTSIADQIEREQNEMVSDSPYDAIRPEDREAIAWVREHGGIESVKETWNRRSNLNRQLETAKAKVERQQRHIEFVQRKCRERRERIEGLSREIDELDDICGGESVWRRPSTSARPSGASRPRRSARSSSGRWESARTS